jgi:HEPN domain-containing protein
MSFEEVEILKERAEAFLKNAKRLIDEKVWDLAAFNLEQYRQLLLKYKLLIKTGTYPRTHSIIRLLYELSKLEPKLNDLLNNENNIIFLTKIEDAYIGSKYLPRKYEEKEVIAILKFIEEVFKVYVERI